MLVRKKHSLHTQNTRYKQKSTLRKAYFKHSKDEFNASNKASSNKKKNKVHVKKKGGKNHPFIG